MPERMILKAVTVDDSGNEISEEIISEKIITAPTDVSNFGYNHSEQLKIIKKMQQALMDKEADFLK